MVQKSAESEKSESSPEPQDSAAAIQVPQLNEFSFDALSGLNDRICDGLRSYNEETLRNMKYSIDTNLTFVSQLVKCTTPQNVVDALNNYLRDVMQQNRRQSERIIRMNSEIAEDLLNNTINN